MSMYYVNHFTVYLNIKQIWHLPSTSCDHDGGMTSSVGCPLVYLLNITRYVLPQRHSKLVIFVKTAWQPSGGGWAVEKDLVKGLTYVCCSQTPRRKVDAPAHLSGEGKGQ